MKKMSKIGKIMRMLYSFFYEKNKGKLISLHSPFRSCFADLRRRAAGGEEKRRSAEEQLLQASPTQQFATTKQSIIFMWL